MDSACRLAATERQCADRNLSQNVQLLWRRSGIRDHNLTAVSRMNQKLLRHEFVQLLIILVAIAVMSSKEVLADQNGCLLGFTTRFSYFLMKHNCGVGQLERHLRLLEFRL